SANAGKTGDNGNFTLRWIKDGTSAAPTNSPSEVDATNAPGVYKITLTADECTCWIGTLCGKSSTADVSIIPLTVAFENPANTIADAVLDRAMQSYPTAKEYTLRFIICMMMNSSLVDNSGFLTVYDPTDAEVAQLPVTTSSSAKPVTGVS
ncbi:MAG: hypothetical protein ACYS7Y_34815, partial [Planctomycetota bacterium]